MGLKEAAKNLAIDAGNSENRQIPDHKAFLSFLDEHRYLKKIAIRACRKEATMEIKLNRNIDSVARVVNTQPKASRPIDSDSALSVFENSRALEARLEELPDVRLEKIETGRKLVGDPAYPPRETIARIATLLAMEARNAEVISE